MASSAKNYIIGNMSDEQVKRKRPPFYRYGLPALCFLAAFGTMFASLVQTDTAYGETIYFYGAKVLFGGEMIRNLASGQYSFTLYVNIYLLVVSQLFLLAAVSGFLSSNNTFNRVFSLGLSTLAIVGVSLSAVFVSIVNHLPMDGLLVSYGSFFSIVLSVIGIVLEIGAWVAEKKEKAKK